MSRKYSSSKKKDQSSAASKVRQVHDDANDNVTHVKFNKKEKKQSLLPRNLSQEDYALNLADHNKRIIVAVGPAGCGKTLFAVTHAINEYRNGNINKIIITRPTVPVAGEEIGFLPGTLNQKMEPWTRPIFDIFEEHFSVAQLKDMVENNVIEIAPFAFLRGRAEPLTALIPTPSGIRQMGDIKVGDYVFGSNGKPTKVTGVFPQGEKPMMDVIFADKSVVRCSEDHLWNTRTQSQRVRNAAHTTKTTKDISMTLKSNRGVKLHETQVLSSPVEIEHTPVPVDPYLLGMLLGDGTLRGGCIHFTSADLEMINEVQKRLPKGVSIKPKKSSKTSYDYDISNDRNENGGNNNRKNPLREKLKELGVLGKLSNHKFIPYAYIHNDVETRLEILRGLMDTDGSIFKHKDSKDTKYRVQFYSTSILLADDVKWLVESLGGLARKRIKITPKNGTHKSGFGHNHDVYVIDIILPSTINPFKLKRKADLFKPSALFRLISDVKEAPPEECQCISVEAEDHLYLTNNFIVTHNTFKESIIIADESQNTTPEQMKMLLTRMGEGSQVLVTGDLRQTDIKQKNGLADFIEKIDTTKSKTIGICKFSAQDIERDPIVAEVLKLYGED